MRRDDGRSGVSKGRQLSVQGSEGPNTRSRTGTKRSTVEGDAEKRDERPERLRANGGGTAEEPDVARQTTAARKDNAGEGTPLLMEEVLRRENVLAAYRRVVRNGGAPGGDGMTVDDLMPYCRTHWAQIREDISSGRYRPQPVLRVEIPKPGGKGTRTLGIPTVLDRMIQQALLQVLQPIFDPTFSEDSYGFRPNRGAHQAVVRGQEHIAEGHRWVVDLDLEKFFDRVNHDILMSRVARRVKDKRVLLLIRRYLQAGMMEGGLVSPRTEGTPQGGPLSPLLSNILLDDLDRELERRGHRFVRYADDCNVYVRSKVAGERVKASLERFLRERLRLRLNRDKSAVARPWVRKLLGYSVTKNRSPKLRVATESVQRLKAKLRIQLRRGRGRNVRHVARDLAPIIRGWVAYFRKSEVKESFEQLDEWLRRRLRCILWRQWKQPRTRLAKLIALGLEPERARAAARNGRGPWWNAGAASMRHAVTNSVLQQTGLPSFLDEYRRLAHAS